MARDRDDSVEKHIQAAIYGICTAYTELGAALDVLGETGRHGDQASLSKIWLSCQSLLDEICGWEGES